MVKRTLRKTISAILAAAIAIGTIGINSIVRTEKINAEQITDEQVLSTDDTNKYIKDNYAQIISNKKYDEANIWGKGVVLLSDAQSSRGNEKNCRYCYIVNEYTVIKYMDEKGLEFSGGEIQKLAIARALYKDAPFYILDEPTASLDALAEKEIYEKFEKITDNKTTVFISHRLASTKFCDRIVLLGPDGVLEQGTHEELMKMNGKYFEMFSIQGKYYQENENEENKVVC